MTLRGNRSRERLIGYLLVYFLLPEGYRIEHTLHLLLLRSSYGRVRTPKVLTFLQIPSDELSNEISLLVTLGTWCSTPVVV